MRGLPCAAAVALSLILTSCSSAITEDHLKVKEGIESMMTPDQARARTHELLENTSNVIGGDWAIEESPLPEQCNIVGKDDGVFWIGRRRQDDRADMVEVTDRVLTYWRGLGFATKPYSYDKEHRGISAVTPEGASVYFSIDLGRVGIDVSGPCVEGDWLSIRKAIAATLPDPYEEYYGTPSPTATAESPPDE
ncbi:hypothetical protein [Okibacterium fritillariae]|nr:hypothetical protein [Okibacterium fritillariae]